MFPLRDDTPTSTTPVVTIGLIVANSLVFLLGWGIDFLTRTPGHVSYGDLITFKYGLIPALLLNHAPSPEVLLRMGVSWEGIQAVNIQPAWLTIFTSMFMHGGWAHILGNMWFLWIFGNNVEDVFGRVKYLIFYLVCGVGAALGQALLSPDSPIPMVGASGAIAGMLGAYLFLFPGARVVCVTFAFIVTIIELPASVVLLFWFGIQFFSTFVELGRRSTGGVAVAAHVGGFAAGWVLAHFLGETRPPPQSRHSQRPELFERDWN
jgi:membrane associated rhomboid family serine protease